MFFHFARRRQRLRRSVDPEALGGQDAPKQTETGSAARTSVSGIACSQQPTRSDSDKVFLQKLVDLERRRFVLYEGRILYRYLNPAIPLQNVAEYRRHIKEIFPADIERDDGHSLIHVPTHKPLAGAPGTAIREPPLMDRCGWSVGLALCKCKETRVTNIIVFAEVALMLCGFMLFISADVIDVVGAQEACELVYYLERTPARAEVSLCGLSVVQTWIGIYAFTRIMRACCTALMVIWTAAAWCTEHTHVAHVLNLARKADEPHLALLDGVFYLIFAFLAKHLKVLESSSFCLGLGLSVVWFGRLARSTARKSARMRGLWNINAIARRLGSDDGLYAHLGKLCSCIDLLTRKQKTVPDVDIKAVILAQDLREQVMAECDDIRELLLEVEALGLEAHDEEVFVRLPMAVDEVDKEAFVGESARADRDHRITVSSMTPGPSSCARANRRDREARAG